MKPFTGIGVLVLAIVGLLQLIRFVLGWKVVMDGFEVPLWFSAFAGVGLIGLAFLIWREGRR